MNDKFLLMLGIAKKAGKLTVGLEALEAFRFGRRPAMIIIASDTAKNSIKKVTAQMDGKLEPTIVTYTKAELGNAVSFAEAGIIGITDKGIAKALKGILEGMVK
ncbi:MAG: hypothetical protein RR436_04890 [Clostridia bacterium]